MNGVCEWSVCVSCVCVWVCVCGLCVCVVCAVCACEWTCVVCV